MELRPAIQIQSMIKAMHDVVLPALDPEHRLAQEQARLIVATLQFMAARLPLAYCYDRDELDRYLALADSLIEHTGGGEHCRAPLESLAHSRATGADVLERARAEPGELESMLGEMKSAIGAVIQAAERDNCVDALAATQRLVMSASKRQLEWERSWAVIMGFDPQPEKATPIENLIAVARQAMNSGKGKDGALCYSGAFPAAGFASI